MHCCNLAPVNSLPCSDTGMDPTAVPGVLGFPGEGIQQLPCCLLAWAGLAQATLWTLGRPAGPGGPAEAEPWRSGGGRGGGKGAIWI